MEAEKEKREKMQAQARERTEQATSNLFASSVYRPQDTEFGPRI
jgi:hypothetical protein